MWNHILEVYYSYSNHKDFSNYQSTSPCQEKTFSSVSTEWIWFIADTCLMVLMYVHNQAHLYDYKITCTYISEANLGVILGA